MKRVSLALSLVLMKERVVQILDVEKMISDVFPSLKDLDDLTLRCIEAIQSQKLILIAERLLSALKTLEKIVQTLELRYLAFPNGRNCWIICMKKNITNKLAWSLRI